MKDKEIDQAIFIGRQLVRSKDILHHLGKGDHLNSNANSLPSKNARKIHLPPSKEKLYVIMSRSMYTWSSPISQKSLYLEAIIIQMQSSFREEKKRK